MEIRDYYNYNRRFSPKAKASDFARQLAIAYAVRDWTIYRCIFCSGATLGQEDGFEIKCEKCEARFPLRENILDTLIQPSPEVIAELQGMANERGIGSGNWRDVKIDKRFETTSFGERSLLTEQLAGQYYQQTLANFDQAYDRIYRCFRIAVAALFASWRSGRSATMYFSRGFGKQAPNVLP